jgi:hypothetical protein
MINDQFVAEVISCISASIKQFNERGNNRIIRGYALCTDNDLGTLLCHVIDSEELAFSNNSDLLFCPTDWEFSLDCPVFDKVIAELKKRAVHRERIDEDFQLMVDALYQAKRSGVFGEDVFLSVLSTDPGIHLERLEDQSVQFLNSERTVKARKDFLIKWK